MNNVLRTWHFSARTFAYARYPVTRPFSASAIAFANGEPPVMVVVRQKLKEAMKSGNVPAKDAIRSVMAAVKNADIEKAGSVNSDIKFHGLVSSLISKSEKAILQYEEGNRADLVDKEKAMVEHLSGLLSEVSVATPEQVDVKVGELLKTLDVDSSDKAAMGKIMAKVPWKEVETEWKASQKLVAESIKRVLNGEKRSFSTSARLGSHENPLGIPRNSVPRRRVPGGGGLKITRRPIPGVEKVIAVSSAKGGVGKSTVAVNLALSLYNQGLNVGILDIDIFGPSLPTLLNLSGEPRLSEDNKLLPLENYGIKAMSMGFLVDSDKAVAWRGLLIQKALEQLLFEVEWGPSLDVLVLDLPPGTGDVQLTLAQQVLLDGAVVVSTPQDIALIDAVRGIDMFEKVDTPVLGLVQNMSLFVCPNCQHETHIFGLDGAIKKAESKGIEVLGSIPLHVDICEASDKGKPITVSDPESPQALPYSEIAVKVRSRLGL